MTSTDDSHFFQPWFLRVSKLEQRTETVHMIKILPAIATIKSMCAILQRNFSFSINIYFLKFLQWIINDAEIVRFNAEHSLLKKMKKKKALYIVS